MKIQPMGRRIYLLLDPVAEKKVGELYVPDTHSELTRTAIVVAIGDQVKNYGVGDMVMVAYTAGRTISPVTEDFTPANDIHRIVSEEEILCKLLDD